mgnify:CR=1 FL=1
MTAVDIILILVSGLIGGALATFVAWGIEDFINNIRKYK